MSAGSSVYVGVTDREKLADQAVAAIVARAGGGAEACGADVRAAGDLAGARLLRIAETVCEREARTNPRLAAVLREAGNRESRIAASAFGSGSSDFPAVLRDAMHSIMLKAYGIAPVTWRMFCNQGSFANFNPYYAFRVGEGENLELVREGAPYRDSKVLDTEETLQGFKYGRTFTVTWETLVNDRWDQIVKQPQRFGLAAARLIEDLVFTHFMGNPTLGDGGVLFRATPATQKNLETGAGSALSATSLATAMLNMAKQTGLHGNEVLNIVPRVMIAPPELHVAARILVESTGSTTAQANAGVINPFRDLVAVVPNARLSNASFTGYSVTAWYLVADPATYDTIEVDFLEGRDTPELFEDEGFEVDGRRWKARICVAVKATDFRSWHKSAGA